MSFEFYNTSLPTGYTEEMEYRAGIEADITTINGEITTLNSSVTALAEVTGSVDLSGLTTTDKTSIVNAINENVTNISNSQTQINSTRSQLNSIFINVLYPPSPLTACVMDGTTDDLANLQAIHDYIVSNFDNAELYIPQGTLVIKNTFYWDVYKVRIKCHGKVVADISDTNKYAIETRNSQGGAWTDWTVSTPYSLDQLVRANARIYKCTVAGTSGSSAPAHSTGTATDGTVTWLRVDSANPYTQVRTNVETLEIKSLTYNTCKGILFTGGEGNIGSSHTTFERCNFTNFSEAVGFKDNSYLIKFVGSEFSSNYLAIKSYDSSDDAGENIRFIDCAIYNNASAIENNLATCDMYFQGCSIDYNYTNVVKANKGAVFMNQCHIEHSPASFTASNRPFIVANNDGAMLLIESSFFMFNGTPLNMDYIFQNDNSYGKGGVILKDCYCYTCQTSSAMWSTGVGVTEITGLKSYSWENNPIIIGTASNIYLDGKFLGGDITRNRNIVTTGDATVTLATGITTPIGSSKSCMKITKNTSAGVAAKVALTVPISHKGLIGAMFCMKGSTASGTIGIGYKYGKDKSDGTLYVGGGYSSNFTLNTSDFQYYSTASNLRTKCLPTCNYAVIELDLTSVTSGIIYIDDILITCM